MINEKWPFITKPDGTIEYIDSPPLSEEDKEAYYTDMENPNSGRIGLYSALSGKLKCQHDALANVRNVLNKL